MGWAVVYWMEGWLKRKIGRMDLVEGALWTFMVLVLVLILETLVGAVKGRERGQMDWAVGVAGLLRQVDGGWTLALEGALLFRVWVGVL